MIVLYFQGRCSWVIIRWCDDRESDVFSKRLNFCLALKLYSTISATFLPSPQHICPYPLSLPPIPSTDILLTLSCFPLWTVASFPLTFPSPQLAFPSHHFPSTPLTSHSFHHTFASPHLSSHLLTAHITFIPLGFHHALLSNHFPLDEHFPHVTLHLWHDLLLTFFSLPLTSLSPAPQLSLLSHHTLSPNLRLTLFLLPLTHCSHHFPT